MCFTGKCAYENGFGECTLGVGSYSYRGEHTCNLERLRKEIEGAFEEAQKEGNKE